MSTTPSILSRYAKVAAESCVRAARAVLVLAISATGCSFDSTPTAVKRNKGGANAKWTPSSLEERDTSVSEQVRKADAERSMGSRPRADSGTPARDADAGRTIIDAGHPSKQPQTDAGHSNVDSADSAPPMEVPEIKDASVPPTTTPDVAPQCVPGFYEGDFDGPITFVLDSFNSVAGSVRAELVLGSTGDFLQIRNGIMIGRDSVGVGMTAMWTGTVDCRTRRLEDGRHEAGAWENGTTFTGTLEGTYAVDPYAMSGTWQVQSEQIPLAGGDGTWRMSLQVGAAP